MNKKDATPVSDPETASASQDFNRELALNFVKKVGNGIMLTPSEWLTYQDGLTKKASKQQWMHHKSYIRAD